MPAGSHVSRVRVRAETATFQRNRVRSPAAGTGRMGRMTTARIPVGVALAAAAPASATAGRERRDQQDHHHSAEEFHLCPLPDAPVPAPWALIAKVGLCVTVA